MNFLIAKAAIRFGKHTAATPATHLDDPAVYRAMPPSSLKALRRLEDRAALGGMRRPDRAVQRLPAAASAGGAIRKHLQRVLDLHPEWITPIADALAGRPTTAPPEDAVTSARSALFPAAQLRPAGLQPDIFAAWTAYCKDPDIDLSEWLRSGAPMGIARPVTPRGVFPPVPAPTRSLQDIPAFSDPTGWVNYRSSESDPDTTRALLTSMVDKGWAVCHSDWQSLLTDLRADHVPINKLALISKQKPDGTWKHRLIWDLLRSEVNSLVHQGERIILPRPLDVVDDARALHGPGGLLFFGTDVADAFHQVPLHPLERRYTVAVFESHFYYFTVLVFGSASAPTVWGRFAAFAARSVAAVCSTLQVRLEIYVDDPLLVARGPPDSAAPRIALAILWLSVLGFPLAWHKSDGGPSITWIGATFRVDDRFLHITASRDKVDEALLDIRRLLRGPIAPRKTLRSLTGRLNFFAGIVPQMRPFLRPLWALASSTSPSGRLPPSLFHTKRAAAALRWCQAHLRAEVGDFRRSFPLRPPDPSQLWCITTDASPWGLGAILSRHGRPVAWAADILHQCDLDRFDASRGDSAFTTVWEALCVLMAIRLWEHLVPDGIALRSDSLATLGALGKMSSPAPGVNAVLREIALVEGSSGNGFAALAHIPGVTNTWADALSRLGAPDAKPVPPELEGIPRLTPPRRDGGFYRAS
jgi:hypothetical protein